MDLPGMTPIERLRAIQPALRRWKADMDEWAATLRDDTDPTDTETDTEENAS